MTQRAFIQAAYAIIDSWQIQQKHNVEFDIEGMDHFTKIKIWLEDSHRKLGLCGSPDDILAALIKYGTLPPVPELGSYILAKNWNGNV